MLTGFSNYDVLDFIMTSDFVEGLTESEFRFLLKRSQKIIRELKSNEIGNSYKMDELNDKIKKLQTEHVEEISNLNKVLENAQRELIELKTKKLTLKERISGKIIQK